MNPKPRRTGLIVLPFAVVLVLGNTSTTLRVRLTEPVSTKTHQRGDVFRGLLVEQVTLIGKGKIPAGARVRGHLGEVKESGRVTGQATLVPVLDSVSFGRHDIPLQATVTHYIPPGGGAKEAGEEGEIKSGSDWKGDLIKGGLATGAGTAVGAVAGGKKGAAVGAVAGAAAGAVWILSTKGKELELPEGTILVAKLESPVELRQPPPPPPDPRIFTERDRHLIRAFYRHRYAHLPPGLAKRRGRLPPGLERQLRVNGTLPPGLQKRMEPFPYELEVELPPLPKDGSLTRAALSPVAIILETRTQRILDLVELDH
ncbi:MAG: hypothetical protein HY652_01765 [Acidobacteria bacterium]|nr:hypothetical protein [Acidobacteriota bacterium]